MRERWAKLNKSIWLYHSALLISSGFATAMIEGSRKYYRRMTGSCSQNTWRLGHRVLRATKGLLAACAGPVFFRIFGFSFKKIVSNWEKTTCLRMLDRSQLQMSQQVKTELSSLRECHSPEAPLGVPKTGQGDFRIMATLSKSHGIISQEKDMIKS